MSFYSPKSYFVDQYLESNPQNIFSGIRNELSNILYSKLRKQKFIIIHKSKFLYFSTQKSQFIFLLKIKRSFQIIICQKSVDNYYYFVLFNCDG